MAKYFFILTILSLQFFFVDAQSQEMLFERIESLPVEQKIEQQDQAIKTIFNLPLELSFITGIIMQEIKDYRLMNCPNYPEELGVDRAEFNQSLKEWIDNYSDEYMKYTRKLYVEINKYSNF